MVWWLRLLSFYVNSSIHVAFSVCALTLIALTKLELKVDYALVYFNFFATILGYNFVKYVPLIFKGDLKRSKSFLVILILTIWSLFSAVYFYLKLSITVMVIVGIFGVLTFLYAIPIFKELFKKVPEFTLRVVPGLKIFVIAIVWAGTTVVLPVLQLQSALDKMVLLLVLQHFLIVVALMIPFEIRDLKYDGIGLKTLPQLFGIFNAKVIGIVICVFVFLIELLKTNCELYTLSLFLIVLIGFICFSRENQSKYFSSFWVEALPIFWLLLMLIF